MIFLFDGMTWQVRSFHLFRNGGWETLSEEDQLTTQSISAGWGLGGGRTRQVVREWQTWMQVKVLSHLGTLSGQPRLYGHTSIL